MQACHWFPKVERYLDDELQDASAIEGHLEECPQCAQHLDHLKRLRTAIAASDPAPTIQDGQFSAFIQGIQQRGEVPARSFRGWWALASLTAAALLVALATFSVLRPEDQPVDATEVETVSTEVEGTTVDWFESDDVETLWENPKDDETP